MVREEITACYKAAAKFLEPVSSTITKLKFYRAENNVVVEGAALFQHSGNQTSSVASCDVFEFSEGRLVGINSYVIELNKLE